MLNRNFKLYLTVATTLGLSVTGVSAAENNQIVNMPSAQLHWQTSKEWYTKRASTE